MLRLQGAFFAEQRGESDEIIVAALLHDIGHFTSEFGTFSIRVDAPLASHHVLAARLPTGVLRAPALADERIALGAINCFAQGGNSCRVERDPDNKGEILITAEKPLASRRNKYTLTALGRDGRWRWFSQLWINAKRPASGGVAQP